MRKWLTIFFLLMPTIVLGQASYDVINVNYKADNLNFNTGNGSKFFNLVLTGNVNTSGLNGGSLGMEVIFNICQDNVGGHTFNWPPNVINPPPINSAALACTSTRFVNIGNFQWTNTGNANGTGAGTPAAGSPPQTQVNDPGNPGHFGGTPCENFPSLTVGPINADCDWHPKGTNPYVDVARYGARAVQQNVVPAVPGITASINNGSTAATLSSASTFQNGDGVTIFGAGPACTLTTPGSPTVTPSLAIAGTGTGFVTNGPTGATTYNYQIIARSKNGCYTPASTTGSTTTGASALGAQSVSISSCSMTNDLVTCTTSAAHGFNVGCTVVTCGEVYIKGTVDNSPSVNMFNGWWPVASAADTTHFTFNSISDTRNGAATSATGGTAQWFNCNHLTWTAVANAWLYYIYKAGTLVGVSRPQASSNTDTTWDDFGSPMMDNFSFPFWIPTSAPGVGASDNLATTIVSGAGTTTLTLAASASTTVGGATILFDDGPTILAAATVITATGSAAAQGGTLHIPADPGAGNKFYVVNSYVNFAALPQAFSMTLAGQLWLNETMEFKIGQKVFGDRPFPQNGSAPQFSFAAMPIISVNRATPGFYVGTANLGSTWWEGITFNNGSSTNGVLQFFAEGFFNFSFNDISFVTGTSSVDYMGVGLYLHGNPAVQSAAFGQLRRVLFVSGPPPVDGSSHTPNFFCNDCGTFRAQELFVNHRGIFFKGDPAGGSFFVVESAYVQGSIMPFLTSTGLSGGGVRLGQVTLDTVPHPMYVPLPAGGSSNGAGSFQMLDSVGGLSSLGSSLSIPSVTGLRTASEGFSGILGGGWSTLQNRESDATVGGSAVDATFAAPPGLTQPYLINANNAAIAASSTYPIFVGNSTPPAPSCSISAGGTVGLATYRFIVFPVWQNNSYGSPSLVSSPCTTTSGQQTITVSWAAVPGSPKGYMVYSTTLNIAQGWNAALGSATTALSVTFSAPFGGGGLIPTLPAGGPTMLMSGVQGIAAPALVLTGDSLVGINPNPGAVVATGYQNSAYDNFNRANGGLGSNWTNQSLGGGTWSISSNQIVASGNNTIAFWNANSFANDQFSQATVVVVGSGGVTVRANGTNNAYECDESASTLRLGKWVTGNFGSLNTTAITGTAGDRLRIEASGTNITCIQNGTTSISATDFAFSSGSPGVWTNLAPTILDNWSGGNLRPIAQLDQEQDWTQPQHFTQPVTIGATNPIAGTLPANTLYVPYIGTDGGAPTCSVTGAGTGATCGTFQPQSDDESGQFLITTGTTPGATGTITLTFNISAVRLSYCIFTPSNTGGTSWNARATFFPTTSGGGSNNQATWDNNGVNLSSTLGVTYICGRH